MATKSGSTRLYVGALPPLRTLTRSMQDLVVRKWHVLRLNAVEQTQGEALGATPVNLEHNRDLHSYRRELSEEKTNFFILVEAKTDLEGSLFSSVDLPCHSTFSTSANEDDFTILKQGHWCGCATSKGPLSPQDFHVLPTQGPFLPDSVEFRFHTGNLYLQPAIRKRRNKSGAAVYAVLTNWRKQVIFNTLLSENSARPLYYRGRGIIAPGAYKNNPKYLSQMNKNTGTRVIGWVAEADARIGNGVPLEEAPCKVKNPGFYYDKTYAVIEVLQEFDEDGARLMKIGRNGEVVPLDHQAGREHRL